MKVDRWCRVGERLEQLIEAGKLALNAGQVASLRGLARRLPHNGVILADEVGMGKTRIAAALAKAVIEAGGRVAVLVPPGLGYQWGQELQTAGVEAAPILRSLDQYLQAWDSRPWMQESAIVISHAFTNWRLGEQPASWRWSLLPQLYAQARKLATGRWPRHALASDDDPRVRRAAQSILESLYRAPGLARPGQVRPSQVRPSQVRPGQARPGQAEAVACLEALCAQTPWPQALEPGEYARHAQLRPLLERAVGLGLGLFDLIIVDEAHKSRGDDSGLNRLLEQVVLPTQAARRLALTATPVELEAGQWAQMLTRIRVESAGQVEQAIGDYGQAVARVRECPSDANYRAQFQAAAAAFQQAMSPYLLRRDKREDPAVIRFQQASGLPYQAYRQERAIAVETASLAPAWTQAVCAAEALSLVTQQADDAQAKRLRLTMGNGHGIAAMLDHRPEPETAAPGAPAALSPAEGKRAQRVQWWRERLLAPFQQDPAAALYTHPAILAACEQIERVCQRGEKVLVFGRFTRPMRALVQLLNAREMLRCLDQRRPWPQSKVHASDDWVAIELAHAQLQRPGRLCREGLDAQLAEQYRGLELQRSQVRDGLIAKLQQGAQPAGPQLTGLLTALAQAGDQALILVARALQELLGPHAEQAAPAAYAQAFAELVLAVVDSEDWEAQESSRACPAADLWTQVYSRLQEEYSRPEGGFARLMHGETKPATRRLLQLAFNRLHGHPQVLVAQSVVGREGLNLHQACRTLVLLHPEWNPGVVEQQIGRVDRIGSLWAQQLAAMLQEQPGAGPEQLPRIEIHPVVFRGTYDEKNWQVLQQRWDELRAQLHGVVISAQIAEKYAPAVGAAIAEINAAAPNFSPGAAMTG